MHLIDEINKLLNFKLDIPETTSDKEPLGIKKKVRTIDKERYYSLLEQILSGAPAEKVKAIRAVAKHLKSEDFIFLNYALNDNDKRVRVEAARKIGELKLEQYRENLQVRLNDVDPYVVEAAAEALYNFDSDKFKSVRSIYKSGDKADLYLTVLKSENPELFDVHLTFFPKIKEIRLTEKFDVNLSKFPENKALKFGKNHFVIRDISPGIYEVCAQDSSSIMLLLPHKFISQTRKYMPIAAAGREKEKNIFELDTGNDNIRCYLERKKSGEIILRFSLYNYPYDKCELNYSLIDEAAEVIPNLSGSIILEKVNEEFFGETVFEIPETIQDSDIKIIAVIKQID